MSKVICLCFFLLGLLYCSFSLCGCTKEELTTNGMYVSAGTGAIGGGIAMANYVPAGGCLSKVGLGIAGGILGSNVNTMLFLSGMFCVRELFCSSTAVLNNKNRHPNDSLTIVKQPQIMKKVELVAYKDKSERCNICHNTGIKKLFGHKCDGKIINLTSLVCKSCKNDNKINYCITNCGSNSKS
ncbi:MAG: hypothetical protein OXE99_07545 [Cellvibrionales bacterium]|nr:hypothetical protein [Cellvibrionales bacterium]